MDGSKPLVVDNGTGVRLNILPLSQYSTALTSSLSNAVGPVQTSPNTSSPLSSVDPSSVQKKDKEAVRSATLWSVTKLPNIDLPSKSHNLWNTV